MKKPPANPAKAIFERLVEVTSPEERAALLEAECGSAPELRTYVESLLRAYEEAESFLEHPAVANVQTELFSETDADAPTRRTDLLPAGEDLALDFLEPSQQAGSLGRLGQYEILEAIGRGGMGIVLKAHDTKLNRVVAVKLLSPDLASNPTARRRFSREAQAAGAVSHDHVVTIHAVEENDQVADGPLPYLVMEFIDGQSLQQKIDRQGPMELKEILRIGRQIADGLAAAHAQGLIHRDVKPSNILLQNGIERVQITDFGLARAVDDVDITRTGEVTGTPQYMSPEQAQGHPVDTRSDLFSLGSVLYAMCTGRSPFRADSTMASLRRVCDDTPRSIREINPDIPDWLEVFINRLLEKDPQDRFQTAEEVAELLGQHLAHLQDPGSSPFPGSIQPVKRRPLKKRAWHRWLIAGLVLFALVGTLGVTEATGVTAFTATVIRIVTGEGTLVIEVDDPTVQISLDGEELSITGAGLKEIKLRAGPHQFRAFDKDGHPVKQELVTITRGDREVVRVTREPTTTKKHVGNDSTDGEYKSIPDGAISEVRRFEGTQGQILALAFSPDGTFFVSSSEKDSNRQIGARLWDLATGEYVRRLGRHGVRSLAISPDCRLVAEGTFTNVVEIFEASSGRLIHTLKGHSGFVWSVVFSPDGSRLLSGGADGTVILWDVSKGRELKRIKCASNVRSLAFLPQREAALLNVDMQGVFFWDFSSGEEPKLVTRESASSQTLDVSRDGASMLIVHDSVVKIVEVSTGKRIWSRDSGSSRIIEAYFSVSGEAVIAGDNDGRLFMWDIESSKEIARLEHQNHATCRLAISPNGRFLLSGGGEFWDEAKNLKTDGDNDIRLWRLPESVWPQHVGRDYTSTPEAAITEVQRFERPGTTSTVSDLAFAPSGPQLLCARHAYYLEVWNLETEQCTVIKKTGERLAVSPRGNVVATSHYERDRIALWNLQTLRKESEFAPPEPSDPKGFLYVSLSSNGRRVAAAGRDGAVRVWDVETGQEIHRLDCDGWIAELSPDGRKILVGFESLRLVDLESRKEIWRHADYALSRAFSPDGRWVAVVSNRTILLRDVATGEENHRFEGHTDLIRSVRFLPDSRHFLSGAEDRTLRLWSIETGREVARVTTDNHVTNEVAVSPDGRHAASGGGRFKKNEGEFETDGDNAIRLWRLPESVWPKKSAAAASQAKPGAFVVLNADGKEVRKFDTLADAVSGSTAGDTIEIRGNGPFEVEDLSITQPLTIRAKEGYSPTLVASLGQVNGRTESAVRNWKPLVLEGLRFQCVLKADEINSENVGGLIKSWAPLRIANCQFLMNEPYAAVKSWNDLSIVNSCIAVPPAVGIGHWGNEPFEISLNNCVLTTIDLGVFDGQQAILKLTNNTFCTPVICWRLWPRIDEPTSSKGPNQVRVQASGNVYDTSYCFLGFMDPRQPQLPWQPSNAQQWFERQFDWQEQVGVFSNIKPFAVIERDTSQKSLAVYPNFGVWKATWGRENSNLKSGTVRFVGGDIKNRLGEQPLQLVPQDFRLRADSAGYQAGPNGHDLGANIDLVGPGKPYQRWKETKAYKAWNHESLKLMNGQESTKSESKQQ